MMDVMVDWSLEMQGVNLKLSTKTDTNNVNSDLTAV